MDNLRICLLNDCFPPVIDGVANVVYNYARILSRDTAVCVSTPQDPAADDSRYPFQVQRYLSLDTKKVFGYRTGLPFNPGDVADLAGFRPDLLHCHSPMSALLMARSIREACGVPLVLTYHTKYDIDIKNVIRSELVSKELIRLLVENISEADEVWAVSRGAGENLCSLGYTGGYRVMPNGVDLPRGPAPEEAVSALDERWNLPKDVPVLLFVGRLMWYKGLRLLLDALEKIAPRQDFVMVVVGSGGDEEAIREYAREKGLMDRCRFVGSVRDREALRAWYSRADLFTFPSSFDTNGLVVREAAAGGTPSVLIRGSCAAEDVTEDRNAFLCEENADDLARVLARVLPDQSLLRRVGQNAMDEIYMTWEDSIARARQRYGELKSLNAAGKLPEKKARLMDVCAATAVLADAVDKIRQQWSRTGPWSGQWTSPLW